MDELSFQPNWFSKPGDTIAALMLQRQLSARQLAEALKIDSGKLRALIAGAAEIDSKLAVRLSRAIGGTPTFWTKRQSTYTAALSRAAEKAMGPGATAWMQKFPQKEMSDYGWVPKTTKRSETLKSYLAYFGVSDPAEWERRYTEALTDVAFRTSPTFESKAGALSAWLRQGEMQASTIQTSPWNEDRLRNTLPELRKLSLRKSPANFIPQIQAICASVGIAVVFVRAPTGCRASGATRFVAPGKAMIVLSFRYRSDDHFWFTFFHESATLFFTARTRHLSTVKGNWRASENRKRMYFPLES
jgi:HTH-type transcriptional regulator/antitoxin HigA